MRSLSGTQGAAPWAAFPAMAMAAALAAAIASGGGAPRPDGTVAPAYDDWFSGEAMRVDLFHTGGGAEDFYSLDEVVMEPLWPGTRRWLLDPLDLGTRRFRVRDASTGTEIFRQGYATLFDEWLGTEESLGGVRRSMSESVRFPWPRKPVVVELERRTRKGGWERTFSLDVDPRSTSISRTERFADLEVVDLADGPAPDRALDVVIVPEGYASRDLPKMRADLARFTETLLDSEPWKSLRGKVHVRGVIAVSARSGPTEPRKGIFHDTILGTSFNTFDSPRYLTVTHTKTLRQIAARAPYDAILVMVNTGRYGGGGVFNQWAIFPSDNEYDDYVMLHEFGHSVAGLGDEYYSSLMTTDEDLMYPPGYEPWEPNLTALIGGGRESAKWIGMIDPSTPIPTPEEEGYAGKVGAFEGAGYKAKGLYRPEIDCKMFHKGLVGFCEVCSSAIERMVGYHAGEDLP